MFYDHKLQPQSQTRQGHYLASAILELFLHSLNMAYHLENLHN